ncbi:MAG: hypothetical protein ACI9FR_000824 [Cryomorphaceae bacterium]|jgi:hypothetical protein
MIRVRNYARPQKYQQGITLIVVMVVLLALTVLGLASTDSGNLQQLMVRNNQFRLEAFNTSHAEIQAQVQFYDEVSNAPIFVAIDSGSRLSSYDPGSTVNIQTSNDQFEKEVGLERASDCQSIGNTLGKYKCNLMRIDSDSSYKDTNIRSDQRQTFTYITLD